MTIYGFIGGILLYHLVGFDCGVGFQWLYWPVGDAVLQLVFVLFTLLPFLSQIVMGLFNHGKTDLPLQYSFEIPPKLM